MIRGTITAKPQVFASAIKWAAKFLAARPAVPIQGGLQLTAEGGRLSVLAFNESATARAVVPFEGDGDGQVVVSGRLLAALAATFPNKPVTITGHGQDEVHDDSITIQVGSWRGTLPTMTVGDFPSPPAAPAVIGRVRGDDIAAAIRRAGVARSDNEKRPGMYHCLHLSFDAGLMTTIGTDMYRAVRTTATFEGDPGWTGPATALVHGGTLVDVAEAFAGPDDVFVGLSDHTLGLASATRAVIVTQSAEKFTVLEALHKLFATRHPEHVLLDASALQAPLKRAELVRDKEGPIRITFSEHGITLAAASDELVQDSDEVIEAKYSGADWTLAFNPRYLGEALASAPGDTVDIELTTGRIAGISMTVPGNDQWQHMLMPIRK